ncbi:MAG: dimethylsulfonioproprionate lyase family protein [Hyphomicrobiaceae bacterium]
MSDRTAELQTFIEAAETFVDARSVELPACRPLAGRIFSALNATVAHPGNEQPRHPAVCDHLPTALAQARGGPPPLPKLADAFAALEPAFAWAPRAGSDAVPGGFRDRHANAVIVGQGGLEQHNDVRIGVSLVAPETDYPRHRHVPEEFYIVLSPGAWMQNDRPLEEKQSGDLVHNVPNVWHAMRSGSVPLLAVWFLWMRH